MKSTLVEQAVNMVSETEKKTAMKEHTVAAPTTATIANGLRIENALYCLDTGKEKYPYLT